MKKIKESNKGISTILAFCLIPITGFALDIYIPSLPDMSTKLGVSPSDIQLSVTIFLASYGIGQLLVGGVLDSYGRYLPNLIALAGFSAASFLIANTGNLHVIYCMRAIQGLMSAVIVVGKRSFFFDLFSGDKLKHYTSLFSIVWSAAPILAPFVGGFLQTHLGWHSNFYFLGCFGLVFLFLELVFSGETIAQKMPFRLETMAKAYRLMISTRDFTAGLVILGLSYGVLMIYNMSSPFLIEKVMHYPATMTGNCSVISGVAMICGSLISKTVLSRPFFKRMFTGAVIQLLLSGALILLTLQIHNLYTLMAYVILLHSAAGFIFNGMLAYCLTRFSDYGGMASGLTGGGYIISTSVFSFILIKAININSQAWLGAGYSILILCVLMLVLRVKWLERSLSPKQAEEIEEEELGLMME